MNARNEINCAANNIPDIPPHSQEILLQKRFDLARAGNLVTVCEVTAIVTV